VFQVNRAGKRSHARTRRQAMWTEFERIGVVAAAGGLG